MCSKNKAITTEIFKNHLSSRNDPSSSKPKSLYKTLEDLQQTLIEIDKLQDVPIDLTEDKKNELIFLYDNILKNKHRRLPILEEMPYCNYVRSHFS